MSDFFGVRKKTAEGAEWRGTITLVQDDEERELYVRMLRDPEFFEIMSMVDRDELDELRDSLPSDLVEEYQELQEMEELGEAEITRLSEIEDEIAEESGDMFDVLSQETFHGIVKAGKYGIEPDREDLKKVLFEYADEIEEEYGVAPRSDADEVVYDYFKEHLLPYIFDEATNFQSYIIGMKVLIETMGGRQGN